MHAAIQVVVELFCEKYTHGEKGEIIYGGRYSNDFLHAPAAYLYSAGNYNFNMENIKQISRHYGLKKVGIGV